MQQAESQVDRRIYRRFTARFPIKIKDSRDDYGSKIFLRDASAEGLQLMTKERFYLNDFISLDIKLPDGQAPLTLNGQVMWFRIVEPNQLWNVGLRFHKVDLMRLQRLYRFVEDA